MTEIKGPRSNFSLLRSGVVGRTRALLIAPMITIAVAFSLLAWCELRVRARDRAMPAVYVEDLDVSGLRRPELASRIQAWELRRKARKIPLTIAGKAQIFDPESVSLGVDSRTSVERVLSVGRVGGFFARGFAFVARRFVPARVHLELAFDRKRLSGLEDEWDASAISNPPFEGGLSIVGTTVTSLAPHSGIRVDRSRAELQLLDAFRTETTIDVLPTREQSPRIPVAEVERVATEARAMLVEDVELASSDGTRRLRIAPAELGSILRVTLDPSGERLGLGCAAEGAHRVLDPYRRELEQAPQNARFVIDATDQVRIEPGRAGFVLNDDAVARALCLAARTPSRKGELPLQPSVLAAFTTEAAEQAGIRGLVGSFTTHHACCQPRVQNIHHIADLLDGTLVRPGETFSVNQLVGPRTVKNGFRAAPSIEDGDMVDTIGGGVSQFATTLFNALFYAGYDIIERQPHSYWFTRYPMGYDATLSYPHPDIVFKNDSDAGALIKTSYSDTSITVKIYGDNGGRRVRSEISERQNIVSPPLELIPNPRLDADEEKTREGGMIGWTVTVKRTLTFGDGKIKQEHRKVTYKPRARRVEVHPCRIPAGQPGHTGERCPRPSPESGASSADAGAK